MVVAQATIIDGRRNRTRCITCFCIGVLLNAIILVTITAIWLTNPKDQTKVSMSRQSSSLSTHTTTATATTTTSTSSTTTTTPSPPCNSTAIGSSTIIYNASSGSQTSYVCHAFLWQSPITKTVNLTFQIQNRPYYWLMDDVSVHDGARELLDNGDFENGSLAPWIRTDPYGPCNGSAGRVTGTNSRNGIYHLLDGSDDCPDFISQSFFVTTGQLYTISFWLKVVGTGPDIHILATIG